MCAEANLERRVMCPLFGFEVSTAAIVFWNMKTCTHVSEECTASIFRVEEKAKQEASKEQ
jgi:hypothetical protein